MSPISYSSSEDEFFDAEGLSEENSPSKIAGDRDGRIHFKSTLIEPVYNDDNEDFDAIYDDSEEHEVGDMQQQHGSVLMHLLSQVTHLLSQDFIFCYIVLTYSFSCLLHS